MSTESTLATAPAAQAAAAAEMDMGALLDSEAGQPGHLRRGEIIEGVVMSASQDGLIVDVGTKTEAVIPQGEMLSLGAGGPSRLKAGDTVRVMVLQPFSAEGHAIVSLDRARGEEGWDVLAARHESGEVFEAEVTGHNRGGILVNVEGVNAFVPLSQVDSVRRDDTDASGALAELVGKNVRLKVIELNRKRNRVILSERAAMAEWRKEQKDRIIDELREGEIRPGTVSSITDFGVFVDLGGADGLAHVTELTWERGKKARELYNVGDEVKAYILKVDRENRKISLSLKRAQPEKWDSTVDRFVIGQILMGRVTKLMAFGAFVRLDGPVEGLIHISELSNRRIQHPKDVVKEGDVVPVKLVRIEKDRHRLGLSLRQARSDAEAMGFAFDHDGRVVDYPDDVREQYGIAAREKTDGARASRTPRSTQEAVEQAVARDEPVTAFAHAFAQALENAEDTSDIVEAPVAELAATPAQDEPASPGEAGADPSPTRGRARIAAAVTEMPAGESLVSVAALPAEVESVAASQPAPSRASRRKVQEAAVEMPAADSPVLDLDSESPEKDTAEVTAKSDTVASTVEDDSSEAAGEAPASAGFSIEGEAEQSAEPAAVGSTEEDAAAGDPSQA